MYSVETLRTLSLACSRQSVIEPCGATTPGPRASGALTARRCTPEIPRSGVICPVVRHHLLIAVDACRRDRASVRTNAKKGKKGKGGKQKKGPGSLMDVPAADTPAEEASLEPYQETDVIMNNLLLVESYSRSVGRPLLEGEVDLTDISQELWEAPFALLAHDLPENEGEGEPIFSYANQAALDLFEAEWSDLVGKPSSISADEAAQGDRSKALDSALEGGKVEGYAAWRRSVKGTRFQIQGATLFNVTSPSGEVIGQGAKIGQWAFEDGRIDGPEAPPDSNMPTEDDIKAAEQAVSEQGDAVRGLKEGKGLTNEDQEVKDAVAELLKRKAKLQKLQDRLKMAEGVATA